VDSVARTQRSLELPRLAQLTVPALVAITVASFLGRLLAGALRATPTYFPDEYMYSELGRSVVESGRLLVRDAPAHFPALVQPLVTAPAWLAGDVEVGYRIAQGLGALAMSLAAVPAFLLARRLGAGSGTALALAAFAVAVPDLLFASWIVAEPFAYPLVLGVVAVGVAALERPSPRLQLAFVALAGLAVATRAQFVVLPACFVVATVAMGSRERRVVRTLREQRLPLALFAFAGLAFAALGPGRALGLYGGVLDPRVELGALPEGVGVNTLVLLYASGWVLVPGALVGVILAFWRPRSRAELAFAALLVPLALALLWQAAVYGDVGRAQERYTFYVLPLLALAFGLYAARGWPRRTAHALAAGGLVTVSALVPLAGYAAAEGKQQSPFLRAAAEVERIAGGTGNGSLVLAAMVLLLSAVVVAVSWRPRTATPVALGLALAATLAASVGAHAFDAGAAADVRAELPADVSWIDSAGVGEVALLASRGGEAGGNLDQLFWNRSLDRVLLLPEASPIDSFRAERVRIGRDGTLSTAAGPVRGPLLVEAYDATVRLQGARMIERSRAHELWQPAGRPRLQLQMVGRYHDGWLAAEGTIRLWPSASGASLRGRLTFRVSPPPTAPVGAVQFRLTAGEVVAGPLVPGTTSTVEVLVCSPGPWEATFRTTFRSYFDGRVVSAPSREPRFQPDPAACATGGARSRVTPAPATEAA
jgi:hypothetical protein